MISGARNRALSLLLALLAGGAADAHDADGFIALMEAFAAVEQSRVTFHETKSMNMLDASVEQSGILSYSAPATVIREIRDPVNETYAIVGDSMRVTRKGEEEHIDLDSIPLLRAFIESFRATLSGDVTRLDEHYRVEFSADGPNWTLQLRPRDRRLARFVELIVFSGAETRVGEIRITEANGDWSLMTLTPAEDDAVGNGDAE